MRLPDAVRPPRSGVSPFPGPIRCRTELGCPSRLGAATSRPRAGGRSPVTGEVTQAHRERELAQGTLGTADHDTRARRTGQSRVPHTHGRRPATTHGR